jgi:hypothetical protein
VYIKSKETERKARKEVIKVKGSGQGSENIIIEKSLIEENPLN